MKSVRKAIVTTAITALRMLFVSAQSRVREAEHAADAALLDRLPRPFDDLVLPLEEAEPAAAAGEVVDVPRDRVGEVVDLAHEGWHERGGDPDDHEDRAHEHDPDSGTTAHAAPNEELDRRVESHGEKERDEHPDDHRARHPQDLEHDRDCENDADHGQDRARAETDECARRASVRA